MVRSDKAMHALRPLIAMLLAVSLSVLPLAAGLAMTQLAKAEMTMDPSTDGAGDDCPCCSPAGKCSTNICAFQCAHVPAVLIEELLPTQPLALLFVSAGPATMSPFLPRPDPPPPRL